MPAFRSGTIYTGEESLLIRPCLVLQTMPLVVSLSLWQPDPLCHWMPDLLLASHMIAPPGPSGMVLPWVTPFFKKVNNTQTKVLSMVSSFDTCANGMFSHFNAFLKQVVLTWFSHFESLGDFGPWAQFGNLNPTSTPLS